MHLKITHMRIYRRRHLPDIVELHAEVPGMGKTTRLDVQLPEGTGLRYLQDYFKEGKIDSYDLTIRSANS